MKKKISVISPCLNEEKNLINCYEAVKKVFEEQLPQYDYEHIFSDNCSSDQTPQMLQELAGKDSNVKVILNSRNFGPFRSMFNALKRSSGDAVITFLPLDLQDPPSLIPEFVTLWEGGYEVVAGARKTREENSLLRACRTIFYRIVNRLAEFEIPEKVGEFQLIDRKVVDAVLSYRDQYPFLRGMIASVGFRRIIVPYDWKKRKIGRSRLNIFMLIDQALNGIFSFSQVPMRICSILGVTISAICVLYSFVITILYLLGLATAPAGTLTLIVALFLLSGIQLSFIGILGEYIGSIHRQSRGGPLVVERETINFD